MKGIRKSVPTEGVSKYLEREWHYVMPDFDNKGHSIIEWRSDKAPVEPTAFKQASQDAQAGN